MSSTVSAAAALTWSIALLAAAGVILRPWRLPEAVWAVLAASALVALGLLPPLAAWRGVIRGSDVYLFLIGMMLLAEVARQEGLFDVLAAMAARAARGSATRLFALVYLVGTGVTVLLSNDATAVVLTPAVVAVARAARVQDPRPYLLVCALVANAASFVLPISNPANLVIYGSQMPPLLEWLPRFALPSALAIGSTFAVLWITQRRALRRPVARDVTVPALTAGAGVAAAGIAVTAIALLGASAAGLQLGLPTCLAGIATAGVVLVRRQEPPWRVASGISWQILPLVAGLFVLVEALDRTGILRALGGNLQALARDSTATAALAASGVLALACNSINNLPAGLIAGNAAQAAHLPPALVGAVLIGTDLGPNLSVTGSLATLLWLAALRREGYEITPGAFLRVGIVVMPPALLFAIAGLLLSE